MVAIVQMNVANGTYSPPRRLYFGDFLCYTEIMKDKIKLVWFILFSVATLAQTALTFYLLYKKTDNAVLRDVILVVLIAYILAFLVIVGLSVPNKKISREASAGYKRSRKVMKRVLTLLILGLSVHNIMVSRGSGVEYALAVGVLVYNLVVILIEQKIQIIKDKFDRKKKKKEREKQNEKIKNYKLGNGNLNDYGKN